MLRPLYRYMLRLHPPGFRQRFADEMLSIFDHSEGKLARAKLLADALLSVGSGPCDLNSGPRFHPHHSPLPMAFPPSTFSILFDPAPAP